MPHNLNTDLRLQQERPTIRDHIAAMNLVSMRSADSAPSLTQNPSSLKEVMLVPKVGDQYDGEASESQIVRKRKHQDDSKSDSGVDIIGNQEVDSGKEGGYKNVQIRRRNIKQLQRPPSASIGSKIDVLYEKKSIDPVDYDASPARRNSYLSTKGDYDNAQEREMYDDDDYDQEKDNVRNDDVESDDDIVCICKIRFNAKSKSQDAVIGCDGPCGQWYHPKCIKEERSCEEIAETLEHWICYRCKGLGFEDIKKASPKKKQKQKKKGTAIVTKKGSDIPQRKSQPMTYC